MDNKENIKNSELTHEEKLKRVKEMREELARNMGTSNYFFYLESNINSRATRGY